MALAPAICVLSWALLCCAYAVTSTSAMVNITEPIYLSFGSSDACLAAAKGFAINTDCHPLGSCQISPPQLKLTSCGTPFVGVLNFNATYYLSGFSNGAYIGKLLYVDSSVVLSWTFATVADAVNFYTAALNNNTCNTLLYKSQMQVQITSGPIYTCSVFTTDGSLFALPFLLFRSFLH